VSVGDLVGGLVAAVHAIAGAHWKDLQLGMPWFLLLLPVVVGAGAIALFAGALPTLSFARGDVAATLPRGGGHTARALSFVFIALAAVLGAVALAQPQVLGEPEPGTTEGIDIVVALDVSGSMRAADFKPVDRITTAKKVIDQYLLTRKRDRVGLVIFAGEAFTQSPLTHDKALLKEILDGVRTGVITDGTAIGDGLATALNRLRDSKAKTKAVILLTDGDNNAGFIAPESATDLAVDLQVKVYGILVGAGGKVPFPDGQDMFGATHYVTVDMPVNPTLVKSIAQKTGGSFYNATDTESLKSSFTKILDSLDRSLLQGQKPVRRPIPLAPLLLLPAALLLAAGILLTLTRASTVP
jgi:Ca-activated chloride channel family protein